MFCGPPPPAARRVVVVLEVPAPFRERAVVPPAPARGLDALPPVDDLPPAPTVVDEAAWTMFVVV